MTDLNERFSESRLNKLHEICSQLWDTYKEYGNQKIKVFVHGIELIKQMSKCRLTLGPLLSHYLCSKTGLLSKRMSSVQKIEFGTWKYLSNLAEYSNSWFANQFNQLYPNIQQVSFIRKSPDQTIDADAFLLFLDNVPRLTHLEFVGLGVQQSFYERLTESRESGTNLGRSLISFKLFDNANAVSLNFKFLSEFPCLRHFTTNVITRKLALNVTVARLPSPASLMLYFQDENCDGHLLSIEKLDRRRCKATITNRVQVANRPNFTVIRLLDLANLESFLEEFSSKLQNPYEYRT